MKKSQNEMNKNYLKNFTRPTIKINNDLIDDYKTFVRKKGYKSLDQYFNICIALDFKKNIIPDYKNVAEFLNKNDD